LLDVHFGAIFDYIGPSVNLALGRTFRLKRVRCHDILLFPEILSLAWRTLEGSLSGDAISSVWLDGFKSQYVYGTMCFTAVDVDEGSLVVFL
jgi:ABC-type anion transport system duplicated permease subunit